MLLLCLILTLLCQSPLVQTCPDQCLCLSQIQVLCNTGKLQEIPAQFPAETQEITISNQNIRVIPQNAFSNLKFLKRLSLDSNNITEIKPFAFKGLSDLEVISVQNNPITRLQGFSFAGIRNVSSLHLGHNQLSRIEGSAFAGTEHIEMLLLNNNPIKTVNSSAFSGLKHVKFLFLPAGVRNLESDAFNGLEVIDKLKLAYLDLSELKPYTFRGLKKLRMLSIENSDLATIRKHAFHGMSEVEELHIVKNKIDRIEDFSIPSPNVIRSVNLDGNHILEVPTFAALKDLRVEKITVTKNHFPCTCDVLVLLHSVIGNSSKFLSSNRCISPYALMGRPMSDMKPLGLLEQCDEKMILERVRHDDDNVMRINSESNDVATPINNDHQTSSSVAKRGSKMMSGVGGVTLTTTTTTERSRYPFSFSAASRNVAIHVSTVATLLTLTFLSAFRRFIVF